MSISLYDLTVPTFLQTVKSVGSFLDRAATHFAKMSVDLDSIVNARLFDDMAPFHFQIEAVWHHSVWGVETLKTGVFAPPPLVGPIPFANLRAMIGNAQTQLEAFTPDEVNGLDGQGPGSSDWPAKARLQRRNVHSLIIAAKLPFSRRHRLRHTAIERRAARQA